MSRIGGGGAEDYFGKTRTEIEPLLPEKLERVLEIGCGRGPTLAWLKRRYPGLWACGIEIDEEAADEAERRVDIVLREDIAVCDPDIDKASFDAILCLDVLEHLADPWSVLGRLREYLRPDGVVIASVPNVRHHSVVGPLLLRGRWEYESWGILDKTHLRFFTRDSAIQLFVRQGFDVERVMATGLHKGSKARWINLLTLSVFRPFLEYQYLIRATPASPRYGFE
jgi:2-polyprenyl-3-methyl-5-hydroxy-6-metoxy-1,4-benzoquinol methylase